jgi:hypothetical protein
VAGKCHSAFGWWQRVRQAGEHSMSWGVGVRNGIAVGLGSLISFIAGYARDVITGNLETESGENLVQEDGGFILLE